MAADIPTTEPEELRAGDTWRWRRDDLADYPASAWTLTYYFRNASAKFDITAAADGDAYEVTVAKATTDGRAVGWYDWVAMVSSATERFEVDRGRAQVLPNLATDAVYDARSFARKMLEYIESALLTRATADQLDLIEAALADRKMRNDRASLLKMRAEFAAEVLREENAERVRQGLAPRNRVLVVG